MWDPFKTCEMGNLGMMLDPSLAFTRFTRGLCKTHVLTVILEAPFGQLPVLEANGKPLAECHAMEIPGKTVW